MVTQKLFWRSKHLYRHGIHLLHYQLQTPSVCTWFYVNKLDIRNAQGQGRLAASSIGCNRDPAEGDFRKTVIIIFEQR